MTEMWPIAEPPLRMCAVEDDGFFIARSDAGVPDRHQLSLTLTKDEKFMLYQQLQQNIEINHARKGRWFLSSIADHLLTRYQEGKANVPGVSFVALRLMVLSWVIKGLLK